MKTAETEQHATLWLVDERPVRMLYAGHRWRITNVPTRLREGVWAMPLDGARAMYGWRFQANDEDGRAFVFDVFKGSEHEWHVHHVYD
ncbi:MULTISPECIES: hypothetical protein [Microbacterium]|jgi:hypothetical protein|uniref:hypothetical protein n=1 Tax=Microbacterium TaxID=33882 RepID=UPI001D179FF4|nr:hypothetical protein [Microbacterium testaceum]MCC4248238.1 hypothetical protein [Microbacterium testaceum]